MAEPINKVIYSMYRVGRLYPPNKQVLRDITLGFYYGAKIGVLGLNGSGKSTLLKIMAGIDEEYIGEISMSKGYTVGYLEQEPTLDDEKTVQESVQEAIQPTLDLLTRFDEINAEFANPEADFDALLTEQASLQEKIDHMDAWNIQNHLEIAMDALGCPPPDTLIKVLSGGERRRVALTRLLLTEPDILLLDEPTNHLDAESVQWLEMHLQQYKGTVISITHDRYFLDNVAGWILELARGHGIPWKGNYTSWLEQKKNKLAVEEKTESKRQRTLQRELDWINMSPKARQAKGKARVSAYEKLLSQEFEEYRGEQEIYMPAGERLGNVVIEFNDVTKAYDDKLLIDNFTAIIPPGSIVGVIGPNGAGKTTTIAKVAAYLKAEGYSVVIGSGDTFRAGANEQMKTHADRVGVKVIRHQEGADPSAVLYDAVEYAKAHNIDVVLADTAGRFHNRANLMNQLAKIKRVFRPDIVAYVDEAVAGNDAVIRAEEFNNAVGTDVVVLTKADMDTKGGAAISIAHTIGRPIMFLGTGQEYTNIIPFEPEAVVNELLGDE